MTDERRERYAAAIGQAVAGSSPVRVVVADAVADAAMAVADAEQRVMLGRQANDYISRLREVTALIPDEDEIAALKAAHAAGDSLILRLKREIADLKVDKDRAYDEGYSDGYEDAEWDVDD